MVRSRSTISAGCASEPCVEMSSSNSVYGDAQSSRIGARRVLGADVARERLGKGALPADESPAYSSGQ